MLFSSAPTLENRTMTLSWASVGCWTPLVFVYTLDLMGANILPHVLTHVVRVCFRCRQGQKNPKNCSSTVAKLLCSFDCIFSIWPCVLMWTKLHVCDFLMRPVWPPHSALLAPKGSAGHMGVCLPFEDNDDVTSFLNGCTSVLSGEGDNGQLRTMRW